MTYSIKYQIKENAETVKSKLTQILATEIKKPYVKTAWNGHELIIKIEKMGSSEIKIQIKEHEGHCLIQESKRNIAFMHKPFISEVEKIIDDMLTLRLGAMKA